MASLSYAEFIILASTLAYSLSEELSESDLALFITFFYIVLADLELIVAQKQIKQGSSTTSGDDEDEEEIDLGSEIITSPINRNTKKRRYKGKKKKYR